MIGIVKKPLMVALLAFVCCRFGNAQTVTSLSTASPQEAGNLNQSSEPQANKGSDSQPASRQPETETGKTAKKKKSTHRGSIVAAPLPIVSPAIGAGKEPTAARKVVASQLLVPNPVL